jgi:hypothetical protein
MALATESNRTSGLEGKVLWRGRGRDGRLYAITRAPYGYFIFRMSPTERTWQFVTSKRTRREADSYFADMNPMGGAAKAAIALGVGVAVLAAGIGIAVALEKPAAAQPQPTPPGPKPSTNPTVTVAPGDAGTLTLPSFAGNTHAGVGETLSLQGPTVAGLTGVITAFTSSNPAVVASLPFAPGSGQTLWTMPVLGPGTTKITYTYLDPTDSTGKRMLTGALTVTVLP